MNFKEILIMLDKPKFEYYVKTWGGFYNEEHKQIHGLSEGDYWFDTKIEADKFIEDRKKIEKELGANYLACELHSGYTTRIKTELHRVIEYEGKEYYTSYDIGYNYPMKAALYHMEYKWYPGFNDYPLGEDFNYSKVKIKQEWVTGAYTKDEY